MLENVKAVSCKTVIATGLFLGVLLSFGVLAGDEQGRINVLHLIFIYVLFPVLTVSVSSLSIVFGLGANLAASLARIPYWPSTIQRSFFQQAQSPNASLIFFYQSQLGAIGFGLGSLAVFFILLLSTDMNFVWRSTILDAGHLIPVLDYLAKPWQFWSAAQPTLSLLEQSQDSRLIGNNTDLGPLGGWWKFIFAAQVCYALLLRIAVMLACRIVLYVKTNSRAELQIKTEKSVVTVDEPQLDLAPLGAQLDVDYALTNWCGVSDTIKAQLIHKLGRAPIAELAAGPAVAYEQQLIAEQYRQPQLVLVKSWEPPLAELADYIAEGQGFVLPLDWQNKQLQPIKSHHLDEWRRFIAAHARWHILQLDN